MGHPKDDGIDDDTWFEAGRWLVNHDEDSDARNYVLEPLSARRAVAQLILKSRAEGAAAGMGLLLMAMAIEKTHWRNIVVVERRYWEGGERYDCFCPGCGAGLKARSAGVHEGTEVEWCGACRDGW